MLGQEEPFKFFSSFSGWPKAVLVGVIIWIVGTFLEFFINIHVILSAAILGGIVKIIEEQRTLSDRVNTLSPQKILPMSPL